MRSIILFLTVLLSFSVQAQTPPAAEQVVKDASAQAAKNNKKVFIIFHASWCGWCHKMDAAMNDASCKKAFDDNYEIRHITVHESEGREAEENPGGAELLEEYAGESKGIPFWMILDEKGELLGDSRMKDSKGKFENMGCPTEPKEISYFTDLLKKTSKMTATDLEAVKVNFSKIKASAAH